MKALKGGLGGRQRAKKEDRGAVQTPTRAREITRARGGNRTAL